MMSISERGSTYLIQGQTEYPSTSEGFHPISLAYESTIHQNADENIQDSGCCLSWFIEGITALFDAIMNWFGYGDPRTELFYDANPDKQCEKQNTLSELAELKKCCHVKSIIMGEVPFSDYGLAELVEKCPNVEKVSFFRCNAAGKKVNEALTKLTHLKELHAPSRMSDAAFSQICQTDTLTHLDISFCEQLTDDDYQHLAHLTHLAYFRAVGAEISDKHVAAMISTSIEVLDLTNCSKITSEGWETIIPTLVRVKELTISYNTLTDPILLKISKLSLVKLWVKRIDFYNQKGNLTEAGFKALASIPTLIELDVSHNWLVNGSVLSAYETMSSLQKLNIRNCKRLQNEDIKSFGQKRKDIILQFT